jgi:hypothetical protein
MDHSKYEGRIPQNECLICFQYQSKNPVSKVKEEEVEQRPLNKKEKGGKKSEKGTTLNELRELQTGQRRAKIAFDTSQSRRRRIQPPAKRLEHVPTNLQVDNHPDFLLHRLLDCSIREGGGLNNALDG